MADVVSGVFNGGAVLNPGAGGAFCTIPAASLKQAGEYRVKASVFLTGTLGAAEQSVTNFGNIAFYLGAVQQFSLAIPPLANYPFGPYQFTVTLDGSTSIQLAAISAGSTGVTYWGQLEAEYLGQYGGSAVYTK